MLKLKTTLYLFIYDDGTAEKKVLLNENNFNTTYCLLLFYLKKKNLIELSPFNLLKN